MDTPNLSTFGDRLRWARTISGASQRELDRLIGTAEGHTGTIEARKAPVAQTDTIARYADALGVSRSWLAWGEGKAPTERRLRAAIEAARLAYAARAAVAA